MNKTLMKQVFASYNFPQTKHLVYTKNDLNKQEILKELQMPIFVKPANLGSSI
jgi:D-alanine-D-alanine ligase-like ATP-grasp enzyme